MQQCRVTDMRNKEVICRNNGIRLGCVDDVEIDVTNAQLVAVIIYGRLRCFGLLGRADDIVIKWNNIVLIGEDTILVDYNIERPHRRKNKFLGFRVV